MSRRAGRFAILAAVLCVSCLAYAAAQDDSTLTTNDVRKRAHRTTVSDLEFSADGSLVSASGDLVRWWDREHRKTIRDVALPRSVIRIALSPDGGHIAAACSDGHVYVHTREGTLRTDNAVSRGPVIAIEFVDDQRIPAASKDTVALLTIDGREVYRKPAPADVTALAILADEFVTANTDGGLQRWDLDTAVRQENVQAHGSRTRSLCAATCAGGMWLASASARDLVVRRLDSFDEHRDVRQRSEQ